MSFLNFNLFNSIISGISSLENVKDYISSNFDALNNIDNMKYSSYSNADFESMITSKTFNDNPMEVDNAIMIQFTDGYVSFYKVPCYPDSISESTNAMWSEQSIVGRSSPVSAYTGAGFRETQFSLTLHRELVQDDETIIEDLLANMRRIVYPKYLESGGYVPGIIGCTFGEYCTKGIVTSLSYNWKKPIIDDKYQCCDLSFTVLEILPSDFDGATSDSYFNSSESPFM